MMSRGKEDLSSSPCLVGCRRLGTALKIAGAGGDCVSVGQVLAQTRCVRGPGDRGQAPGTPACPDLASVSSDQTGAGHWPNVSMYYADPVLNIRLTTRSLGGGRLGHPLETRV